MDDPFAPGRFARSDYIVVFEQGGAEALNRLLRQRFPVSEVLASELLRMEQTGWEIAWDQWDGSGEVRNRTNG